MKPIALYLRRRLVAAAVLCCVSSSLAGWALFTFVQQERLIELSLPEQEAQRRAVHEDEENRARQREQICSVVEYIANMLRKQGARCYEVPKKGSGITDGIDLSRWHGTDADLSLLRGFLFLDDDDRENLHNNRFTLIMGPNTTDASLTYLKDLTNLKDLSIRNVPVTDAGLEHLKKLTRLEAVDLAGTCITDSGLEILSRLPDLWRIDVTATDVTLSGIAEFSKLCPSVKIVFDQGILRGGNLDLRAHGGRRTGLHGKNAEMSLTEAWKGLTKCRQFSLVRLDQSDLSNDDLAALEGQSELEQLGLSETQIGDEGLKHLGGLTKLHQLNLDGTAVTDNGLKHLGGLSQITFLTLGRTRVTADGVKTLKQTLLKCFVSWNPSPDN